MFELSVVGYERRPPEHFSGNRKATFLDRLLEIQRAIFRDTELYEERAKWLLNESYADVGIPFLCHAEHRTEGNGEEGQCKNRRRASLKTKTRRMQRTALLLFIKMKSAGLGGRSVPPCHPCVNSVSYFIISFYVATVRFKRNR